MSAYGRGIPWRSLRSGRGNGRGRGGWLAPQATLIARSPSPPLGELIESVTPRELVEQVKYSPGSAEISDSKFLASFNWVDGKPSSIIYPGTAPVWKPLEKAKILDEDSGTFFRDQNAARYPQHPIEPATRAVLSQSPNTFNTQGVDIFACTSTLGNLFRFVKGDDKPFRILVEAVGNTVFFVRRENAPDEVINWDGQPIRGYGHSFPDRYTECAAGEEGSVSHQRIISQDFCGLRCLVRFEADGYLEEEARLEDKTAANPSTLMDIPNVKTHTRGTPIPQHAIFDLKTRSMKKRDQVDQIASEQLPRLWQAQIPFLILAFHDRGRFSPHDILVQDMRGEVKTWQEEQQDVLRKLGVLLKKLVHLARDGIVDRKFELVCSSPQSLEIRKQGGEVNSALCDEMRHIWLGSVGSPVGSEEGSEASGGASLEFENEAAYSDAGSDRSLDYTACNDKCGYCGRCKY